MLDYASLMSRTVQQLKPSGIRKFFDILGDRKDVISLTVGEPDFATPWHVRDAAVESLQSGKTYYTSNAGLPELRNEIAAYLRRRFDLDYDGKNEIVVTVGGSEGIDLAIRTMINPGDEVILPQPAFVCYEPLIEMAGGIPVIINTQEKNRFKLMPEELRAAITPRTKLLILPYPNNPTGAIMTKEDLAPIAAILRETDICILSDEIYAELTYDRPHISIASLEGMRERTIVVNGFSKAYAMTGWRLGFTAAPAPITRQMVKVHQFAIMCAPTVSQYAAIEALRNGDEDIAYMAEDYNRRRRYIVNGFRTMGIDCFEPEGAFYVYPNISRFGMTSDAFCERLLYEHNVAIVPGTAFGACGEGFARVSYAYSIKHISTALERIEHFIQSL